jgi:ferredoxin-fold anticodon binding domain-containing protein
MSEVNFVISQAKQALKALNDKIEKLDTLFDDISTLKKGPEEFNNQVGEAFRLTKDFTNSLEEVSSKFVNANNQIFANNLTALQKAAEDLNTQVGELSKVDLEQMFSKMQKRFFDDNTKKMDTEVLKFQTILRGFQEVSAKLVDASIRLEALDLTTRFQEIKVQLEKTTDSVKTLKSTVDAAITGIQNGIKEILDEHTLVTIRIEDLGKNIEENKLQILKQIQLDKEAILSQQASLKQDVTNEIHVFATANQKLIEQLRTENQELKSKVDRNLYTILLLALFAAMAGASIVFKIAKYF